MRRFDKVTEQSPLLRPIGYGNPQYIVCGQDVVRLYVPQIWRGTLCLYYNYGDDCSFVYQVNTTQPRRSYVKVQAPRHTQFVVTR